jgi:hypothetical protein
MNHLFISYAHIDNYYDSTSSQGWIDLLHERLEIRLSQLLGRKPTIWRDRKIQGNDVFNQTIHIELGKAAILLSVVTPRYIASSSCQDELNTFIQTGGLRLDDKHRIFKVVKTHVPLEKQPPELQELLGYEFYQFHQDSGRFREFDHENSARGEKDKRYWDKFEDLAQDIKLLLERIEQPDAPSPPANGKTIYLAETTSDLADHRDKVQRELRQFGHVILPDQPLPTSKPKLEQLVRGCLNQTPQDWDSSHRGHREHGEKTRLPCGSLCSLCSLWPIPVSQSWLFRFRPFAVIRSPDRRALRVRA